MINFVIAILRPLMHHSMVLAFEGSERQGLSNALILVTPGHPFILQWLESYRYFNPDHYAYQAVYRPKFLNEKRTFGVCTLPPDAFCWPIFSKNHGNLIHETRPSDFRFEFQGPKGPTGSIEHPLLL